MRDLKHLLYFENLLQEANNELVQKAVKEDGKLALGYTCYHVPEVLLNLDNCVSVRLRGVGGHRNLLSQPVHLRICKSVARKRHRGRVRIFVGIVCGRNLQRDEQNNRTFRAFAPCGQRQVFRQHFRYAVQNQRTLP